MKQNLRVPVIFVLTFLLFIGCKKKQPVENGLPETPDTTERIFVSANQAGTFTSTQLKFLAASGGFEDALPLIKYDVSFVKIIYKTKYKGVEINASGMLVIPKNTAVAPSIISAQHGNTFQAAAAPSNVPNINAFTGYELLSASGFITVIPDYIGHGVSDNLVHPYFDMQHSALAVTDMLKAVTEYLKQEKIAFNERLFMIGYSEGGYVTMAAQKSIEANPIAGLSLKAVAAGAGGYDISSLLASVINDGVYSDPAYIAFILYAYNETNGWKRPLTDFFKEPYASKIPALLDGSNDAASVSAALTTDPAALLNANFFANMQIAGEETVVKAAFTSNGFLGWVPKSPTRMYHGTADQTVFYESTRLTYDRFKSGGAPRLELIPVIGGTHDTTILPMMLNAMEWFHTMDK